MTGPLFRSQALEHQKDRLHSRILVKESERVAKDQPLVIVDGDKTLTNGVHLEDALLKEYNRQQNILTKQLSRTTSIFKLKTTYAQQQLAASTDDLAQLNAQITTLQQRYMLAKGKADNYKKMVSKKFVSSVDGQAVIELQHPFIESHAGQRLS